MKSINLRKKEVPDELPELISEEIEKESKKDTEGCYVDEDDSDNQDSSGEKEENEQKLNAFVNEKKPENQKKGIVDMDRGFFKELEDEIYNELNDLEGLQDKLDDEFDPDDILKNMKNYWKKQKQLLLLENTTQEYKQRLSEKISSLKTLENSWQSAYFELIKKEEKIKEEEESLKELLHEFMGVVKNKKDLERKRKKQIERNKKPLNKKKYNEKKKNKKD